MFPQQIENFRPGLVRKSRNTGGRKRKLSDLDDSDRAAEAGGRRPDREELFNTNDIQTAFSKGEPIPAFHAVEAFYNPVSRT